MDNLQLVTNLDDSPELLAPFVLLTDFLWLGVEWWLCPCVSLLMLQFSVCYLCYPCYPATATLPGQL